MEQKSKKNKNIVRNAVSSYKKGGKMKNFILAFGKFFINFIVAIQLVATIAISFYIGNIVTSLNYDNVGLGSLAGLSAFFILFFIVVMSNFLLCLIIGMHDSLASIAKSLEIISHNNTPQKTTSQVHEQNILKCPNCGTVYNEGDNFCEECGTKLN